ncbi:MAG: glycoside hydrolase family 3 N-terminal domain-containing protein, partial [bacterium]
MPYAENTAFSFFSQSCDDWLLSGSGSGEGKGGLNLKTAFENAGFKVNDTLWNFYKDGNGKSYKRGTGVIGFGDDEDWSINECPLSVLKEENGLLDSAKGTTAVFVLSRTAGEGRDLARGMYRYTDKAEDQAKSYLEPDSVELEIINYLNENFDDVVLLVNSANTVELGWTSDYENIHSIIWAPGTGATGLNALPRLMKKGGANFSGHLV